MAIYLTKEKKEEIFKEKERLEKEIKDIANSKSMANKKKKQMLENELKEVLGKIDRLNIS